MNCGCIFCRFESVDSYPKKKLGLTLENLVNGHTRKILGYNKTFKSAHDLFYDSSLLTDFLR